MSVIYLKDCNRFQLNHLMIDFNDKFEDNIFGKEPRQYFCQ